MFLQDIQNLMNPIFVGAKYKKYNSSLEFEHEDLIGFAKITQHSNYVELDQMFLRISKQRIGIGTKFLDAVITACKTNGINRIECQPTTGGALSGLEFCKKHNFTQIGTSAKWEKCF